MRLPLPISRGSSEARFASPPRQRPLVLRISDLELREIELSTEPVIAFFQIRISNADGTTRTVTKRYGDLVGFFADVEPMTGFPPLPANDDEVALARDPLYRNVVQDCLDALLNKTEVMDSDVPREFFQLAEQYQVRSPDNRSLDASPRRKARALQERVDRLMASFYEHLLKRYETDDFLLKSRAASSSDGQAPIRGVEWLWTAKARSLRHLDRHPEWLHGSQRFSDAELHQIMAVQHFVDQEIRKQSAEQAATPSEAPLYGIACHISRQFVLDAPRSTFVIDGRTFSLKTLRTERPCGEKMEEELLRKLFSRGLVEAVEQSLARGGEPTPTFVRAVTTIMSQAGMANVDLACDDALHVVVSGGEQCVGYELHARADGSWDVSLSVRRTGFDRFVICRREGPQELLQSDKPRSCSPTSVVSTACSIRLSVPICGSDSDIEADVLSLRRENLLFDGWGRPISLEESDAPPDPWVGCLLCGSSRQDLMRVTGALVERACGSRLQGLARRLCWKEAPEKSMGSPSPSDVSGDSTPAGMTLNPSHRRRC
mmetsp:Transcript_47351/g.107497  ORF Transcript_47351/g.107497 Transcript_47351/m.107497 type:complete len:545 (-) Transcript_47351:42-1676(-)